MVILCICAPSPSLVDDSSVGDRLIWPSVQDFPFFCNDAIPQLLELDSTVRRQI
jgi:hypothetical protein